MFFLSRASSVNLSDNENDARDKQIVVSRGTRLIKACSQLKRMRPKFNKLAIPMNRTDEQAAEVWYVFDIPAKDVSRLAWSMVMKVSDGVE